MAFSRGPGTEPRSARPAEARRLGAGRGQRSMLPGFAREDQAQPERPRRGGAFGRLALGTRFTAGLGLNGPSTPETLLCEPSARKAARTPVRLGPGVTGSPTAGIKNRWLIDRICLAQVCAAVLRSWTGCSADTSRSRRAGEGLLSSGESPGNVRQSQVRGPVTCCEIASCERAPGRRRAGTRRWRTGLAGGRPRSPAGRVGGAAR
jgi:hypothetical protein